MGLKDLFSIFKPSANKSDDLSKSLVVAEKMLEQNNLSDAEKKLKNYIVKHSDDFKALEMLGLALLKQNKYDEAFDSLTKAVKLNYDLEGAYKNILFSVLKSENYKKGEKFFKFVIKNKPDYSYPHFALARIYEFFPDFEAFKRHLDKAIRLNSLEAKEWKENNLYESYNNISESLIKSKKYKELIDFIEKNFNNKKDINVNNTKINLAIAYKEIGKLSKAESIFKELILNTQSTSISQAFYHLSLIYEETNRLDAAKLLLDVAERKREYKSVYNVLDKQSYDTQKEENLNDNVILEQEVLENHTIDNIESILEEKIDNNFLDTSNQDLTIDFTEESINNIDKKDNESVINNKSDLDDKYILLITKKDLILNEIISESNYDYKYITQNDEVFNKIISEISSKADSFENNARILTIKEKISFVKHIIIFEDKENIELKPVIESLALKSNGFIFYNNIFYNEKFEEYLSKSNSKSNNDINLFNYENAITRKNKTNLIIQSRHINIKEELPPTISEEEAVLKEYKEVANKAFLYYYIALKNRDFISINDFKDLIDKQDISDYITKKEENLLNSDSDNDIAVLEFLKVMLWSVKAIFHIGFPDKEITLDEITHVINVTGMDNILNGNALRPEKEILDHLDLIYRINFYIKEEKKNTNATQNTDIRINEQIVEERLNALKWLTGYNMSLNQDNMNKELIQDYKNTDYIIYPNDIFKKGLVIRIDQNTPELDIYLKSLSLNSWVFITAYNPFSREESEEINHKNQKDLISEIKNDYRYFEGEGKGNNTDWKAEKSILILGISKEKALELKNKYSQNAVVFGELNNRAKLA